jgi:hypothetical protein
MTTRILMASAIALASIVTAANALTISNEDKSAYTVTVMPVGGKTEQMSVPAEKKVSVDCAKGCTLKLNGHEAKYDAKAAGILIKHGKFAKM